MATTMGLSIRIDELEGELALCQAVVEKGVSSAELSYEDVPKPKEFVGIMSVCDVENFLSSGKVARDNATGIVGEYVREFKELMVQVLDVTEKEALLAFQNRLKPWVRQKVEQRGVQKLLEAMTVGESVVKLGLRKESLGLPSQRKWAYVKRITRKMLMEMATTTIVVIRNHELGRRNPRRK
ncbi:hypothetical protein Goshw_022262 [Gossypium schwendimanii]|uniref:Uncharacterized protein n=1 Tax=Gossypium schwendimanii TaxID=34291 RepID=A0A7J9N1Z6_GOSSC|nr:hypothetical protein [Gossypium schwendimanii]